MSSPARRCAAVTRALPLWLGPQWMLGAAAAALAAVALILIPRRAPPPVSPPNYTTAVGEVRHLVLADGSVVDLNTDTQLRVSYTPLRRGIELSRGEALFKVHPALKRPFEVRAGGTLVQALGTAFSVRLPKRWSRPP